MRSCNEDKKNTQSSSRCLYIRNACLFHTEKCPNFKWRIRPSTLYQSISGSLAGGRMKDVTYKHLIQEWKCVFEVKQVDSHGIEGNQCVATLKLVFWVLDSKKQDSEGACDPLHFPAQEIQTEQPTWEGSLGLLPLRIFTPAGRL